VKRLITAAVSTAAFALVPATAAQADTAQVTEFPYTEAVYNPCNDDVVLINGTLVDSMTISQASGGGVTYDHRVWWKDVSASSKRFDYTVTKGAVDTFRTRVVNGAETMRSLQADWLRLKPRAGAKGELRVVAVYAFATNDKGVTRTLEHSSSTCR
jgi:hypothetical protein